MWCEVCVVEVKGGKWTRSLQKPQKHKEGVKKGLRKVYGILAEASEAQRGGKKGTEEGIRYPCRSLRSNKEGAKKGIRSF